MSQIGMIAEAAAEAAADAVADANASALSVHPDNPVSVYKSESVWRTDTIGEELQSTERATALLVFSILGLLGNSTVLVFIVSLRRLQKPNNSFFAHQCLLDAIKSGYCIAFSRSLFHLEAPRNCAVLGASYLVFVTTSAFNIMAITVNEMYHFTNEVIGIQPSNRCCVAFGVAIIWFSSIVINLGVAFLPTNPTFDRAVDYCTIMYGVTGNYLLHILWVVMITVALLLTAIYLRKFWIEIRDRKYYRVATLFHQMVQLNLTGHSSVQGEHINYVDKTIIVAKRNLYILVGMVTTFVLFWYPLFILTLSDPHFKANPQYYKTLTIVSWCHPAFTPIFFIAYNLAAFQKLHVKKGSATSDAENIIQQSCSSTPRQVVTESDNTSRSSHRPNSLNVTPAYHCHHHLSSGPCASDGFSSSAVSKAASLSTSIPPNATNEGEISLKYHDHKQATEKRARESSVTSMRLSVDFDLQEEGNGATRDNGKQEGLKHDNENTHKRLEKLKNTGSMMTSATEDTTSTSNNYCRLAQFNTLTPLISSSSRSRPNYGANQHAHATSGEHVATTCQSLVVRSVTLPNDLCTQYNGLLECEQIAPSPCITVHDSSVGTVTLPVQIYTKKTEYHDSERNHDWWV